NGHAHKNPSATESRPPPRHTTATRARAPLPSQRRRMQDRGASSNGVYRGGCEGVLRSACETYPVILSEAKDPPIVRFARSTRGSFASLRMTGRAALSTQRREDVRLPPCPACLSSSLATAIHSTPWKTTRTRVHGARSDEAFP